MTKVRRDTFSKLFLQSNAGLRRYVRRFVRSSDLADEIAQEAWLRTYKHARDDRPHEALLYSIARNLAVDHYRHERRARSETHREVPQAITEGGSLENWILAEERSTLLRDAVEQLPRQCRAAFALKVLRGLNYQEIAARLGISCKTVEGHVSRGIRETYRYLRRRYQLEQGSHRDG